MTRGIINDVIKYDVKSDDPVCCVCIVREITVVIFFGELCAFRIIIFNRKWQILFKYFVLYRITEETRLSNSGLYSSRYTLSRGGKRI